MLRKFIPFIIMAIAIVVANNLFAEDLCAKEEAKAHIQAPTPAAIEAAPQKPSGCGCGH